MNICETMENLISYSVDGTLTEEEKQAIADHVAGCDHCMELLSDYVQMKKAFREEIPFPSDLHDNIMESVREETKFRVVQPERQARRFPVFTMVAAAAIVVVIAVSGGVSKLFGGSKTALIEPAKDASASSIEASTDAGEAMDNAAAQEFQNDMTAAEDKNAQKDAAENGAMNQQIEENMQIEEFIEETEEFIISGSEKSSATAAVIEVVLPDSIKGMNVAQCYIAEGAGALPEMEGKLLLIDENTSYYTIENNVSVVEKTLSEVEKTGYDVSLQENIGLVINEKAKECLLIVIQTE